MVPAETTVIIVENEMVGAQAWAKRRNVALAWVPERLEVRAVFTQPETEEPFFLRGWFPDYRVLPPVWIFTDASWSAEPGPSFFPRPAQTPFGGSLFTTGNGPVICAPFNRLAYAEHRGPHGDWGGPIGWVTAGQAGQVKAHCIGDMLQVILRDLLHTRGRMA